MQNKNGVFTVLAALLLITLASPILAEGYDFTAKNCEFTLTYPEEPSTAEACNPEQQNQCHQVSTFTKVYALDSSIRITTTCNDAEPGMLERYKGEVMEFTLETMARKYVDDFETGFNDFSTAKQAILLGNKIQPDGSENVYMAQLWIGKKSVFTIEGKIAGAASEDADALFSDIFKSIRQNKAEASAEKPKSEEKSKD